MPLPMQFFLMILAFSSIACLLFQLITDEGHNRRDGTIRQLRADLVSVTKQRDEKTGSLHVAELRLGNRDRELADLRSRVDRVAEILGFGDDEEEEDEEEDDERKPYAFSINGGKTHTAYLVYASSAAEALGKGHRYAEKAYPDKHYSLAWTGKHRPEEPS